MGERYEPGVMMPRQQTTRKDQIDEARYRYDMALDRLEDSRSDLELAEALTAISLALTDLLRAVRQPRAM